MKREDLYTLRKSKKDINHLQEEIAALELLRISPRNAAYGSERVQTSGKGDVQAEQIAKIDELIELYRNKLNEVLSLQTEFERLIEPLKPHERRIMRYYYLDGMIWEEIWDKEGYCFRHLMRIHKGILAKLFPVDTK